MTMPSPPLSQSLPARPAGPGALFLGFLEVGVLGFGGVLAMARRVIVERRGWLGAGEFTDLYALCQFLPGPNICNMSVVLGRRYHGLAGSVAALSGLMAAPVAIALVLVLLYGRYGGLPWVGQAFAGLAAAASGLILGTAVKLALPLGKTRLGLVMAAVTFLLIAGARLPLVPVMLVLAPFSVWLHFRAAGRLAARGSAEGTSA